MVHLIAHEITPGLAEENAVHNHQEQESLEELKRRYPTLGKYLAAFMKRSEGIQFQQAVAFLPSEATILDVGVGAGHTSLYLAAQGHRVSIAEPALGLCRRIQSATELYGLGVEIYNVSAEYLDRLPVQGFTACIFNASLHHCDDPLRALRNCHGLLRPGGKIFLLHEPLLQFFRSKAWFQRCLELGELPGHYGGNEHTYYYHEYRAMLRQAGFVHVQESLALRYWQPQSYFQHLRLEQASRLKKRLRKEFYRLIRGLARLGRGGQPILGLLKRLSLLQINFIATKEPAATPGKRPTPSACGYS